MGNEIKINAGPFTFDCRVAGLPDNEPVVLLHGFPESSCMWVDLLRDISAQGFYCIAPDLRGYSKGARPSGKQQYTIDKLVQDVLDIAEAAVGARKFHLIGHDWGAVIGWKTVHDHPDKILSWTALSIPHYQAFGEAVVNDGEQKRMSRYMKDFQWPLLPEFGIRKKDFALFRSLWRDIPGEQVEQYLAIFRDRGALTAALNYYRANYGLLRSAAERKILGDIPTPTLFVWGKKDLAVGATGVEKGHAYLKGYYKFLALDAGHWLIHTQYAELQAAILEHLAAFRAPAA